MNPPVYSEIPETSDSGYWLAVENALNRSTTFLPRDRALHQSLKAKAWAIKQASLSKKAKKGSSY
ncbi:hypothetical protein GCM10027341_50160 [Spirosoma knui]